MENLKAKVIGVVMGGVSDEREVSLRGGAAVLKALTALGYEARELMVDDRVAEQIRDAGIEVAFLVLHGGYGEDGRIQALCEMLKIPYTGSGVLASALAMNKSQAKAIFSQHGIPTPRYCPGVSRDFIFRGMGIRPPLVVKPNSQGSTLGVSIVMIEEQLEPALQQARKYDDMPMVEEYIEGRELTVGVLDGQPMGVVEVVPRSGFYDYRAKYTQGQSEYVAPAAIPADMTRTIEDLGRRAYETLGCRGAARVDFRLHSTRGPFVLEVNTIPGMTEVSLLPMSAKVAGIGFNELVERMLKGAFA